MKHIIEVDHLTKSYGAVQAIRDISFYVEEGKLFAFLGPNGAGKSTAINMISTLLKPDSGSILVHGHKVGSEDAAIRNYIGSVFQNSVLDDRLTVEENIKIRGAFYGLRGEALNLAVKNAMDTVDIADLARRPYGKLSGGQRRRCDIARALVHTPKVLFLDEPTTGLDPQTRQGVWQNIRQMQQQANMTVFLTTHYMEEAAEADYVIIIDDGKIAARGTPSELRQANTSDKLVLMTDKGEETAHILTSLGLIYQKHADRIILRISDTMEAIPIVEACRAHILGFEVTTGTMDDAFIGVTGKEIRG